jgi:FkbM family methyltransferase
MTSERTKAAPCSRSNFPDILHAMDLRPRGDHEVDDRDIAEEVLVQDQYRLAGLAGLPLGVVLDVGAHIGFFSCALLALHPSNRVEAFEPDAENFICLSVNLAAATAAGRAHCHPFAVGTRCSKCALRRSPGNRGGHRTLQTKVQGDDREVSLVSIDRVLADIPEERIGLFKLDCEGCEHLILGEGSDRWLGRIDLILMELHHTSELAHEGCTPESPLERLVAAGFETFLLEDILYPGEGQFWVVAGVHPRGQYAVQLSHHYRGQRLRYSGTRYNKLQGWLRSLFGRVTDPVAHVKTRARKFLLGSGSSDLADGEEEKTNGH